MTSDSASSEPGAIAADPEVAAEELVPGWLQRLAAIGWRILAAVALVVVAGSALVFLSTVTGAILVALVVTATVYPLVQGLRQRGWPRGRSAAAVSFLALFAVLGAIILIALAFVPYIADVFRYVREGVVDVTERLQSLGLPAPILDIFDRTMDGFQEWVIATVQQLVGPIAGFVTVLILGGFLTFYLLEDGDHAWEAATKDLDDWRADLLTGRGMVALEQVGGYLRGTTVMAAVDAVTDFLFLSLLNVPLAGPLAVLVFIGGFIPYLGGIVTVLIIALVTLASQGILATILLLVLVAITNVFEARLLAHRVYAHGARLPAALAFVALPAGAALFGTLGLFITLPLVATVVAFAPAVVNSLGSPRLVQPTDGLVPVWLDRLGQWSWRILVVLGIAWLLVQIAIAPFFSAPVVLALLFSAVLIPVANALRQRGMGGTQAALAVTAASIAIIVVVATLTIVVIAQSLPEIVETSTIGAGNLGFGSVPVDLAEAVGNGLLGALSALLANLVGVAIALLLAIFLTFFFIRDGANWWGLVVARVEPVRRDRIDKMGLQAADILRGTTVGTALSSFAGAVLQWFTMFVLGLPLAFPIGVLTFFAGFIPYIGSLITTTLGFLVAVAVGDPIDIVLMAIFTIVFNIVQGNVVAPLVFGKTVSIHPAAVLLAAPAGAAIGGILGMVMIVPFLAIISRTWRTAIHLFDPEDAGAAPAPSAELVAQAAPAPRHRSSPAAEGAEP